LADKVTVTKTLGIGYEYLDSETQKTKTVYLKVPNPKDNLTESQIKTAALNFITGEDPVFLPPENAEGPFETATAIATAYREEIQTTNYDIGVE